MMGIVGAGGIGVELILQMNSFKYQNVSTILIIVVILVAVINRTSAHLRKGIIEGTIFKDSRKNIDYAIVIIGGLICVASLIVTQADINWSLFITGMGEGRRYARQVCRYRLYVFRFVDRFHETDCHDGDRRLRDRDRGCHSAGRGDGPKFK